MGIWKEYKELQKRLTRDEFAEFVNLCGNPNYWRDMTDEEYKNLQNRG